MSDYGLAVDSCFEPGFDFELRDYDESFPHGVPLCTQFDFPEEYQLEPGREPEVKK